MAQKKENITESLKKLRQIVEWFEQSEEVDVEEGLLKVKEGAELIKICKARLGKIENEFKEILNDQSA